MRTSQTALVILLGAMPGFAHRLDEYLQATLISVEKNRVEAQMRLTPGVAVVPVILGQIDRDGDGVISEGEQREYARTVVAGLMLTVDGERRQLRLLGARFPTLDEMREGRGEIKLDLTAAIPSRSGRRRLIFENHHQAAIAAYLVNCLVPSDSEINFGAQNRNYEQSFYELDYVQAGGSVRPGAWLGAGGLLLCARLGWLWWSRRIRRRRSNRPVSRLAGERPADHAACMRVFSTFAIE